MGSEGSEKEGRQELANDRTKLSEDRTILANERTYASWMRTGMASVAVALGFRALLGSFEPAWVVKLIATVFVLVGAAVIWFAFQRARDVSRRLNSHEVESISVTRMGWLSMTLIAAALALAVVLWFA